MSSPAAIGPSRPQAAVSWDAVLAPSAAEAPATSNRRGLLPCSLLHGGGRPYHYRRADSLRRRWPFMGVCDRSGSMASVGTTTGSGSGSMPPSLHSQPNVRTGVRQPDGEASPGPAILGSRSPRASRRCPPRMPVPRAGILFLAQRRRRRSAGFRSRASRRTGRSASRCCASVNYPLGRAGRALSPGECNKAMSSSTDSRPGPR